MVEILTTAQERQKIELDESTDKATTALHAVEGQVEERTSKLGGMSWMPIFSVVWRLRMRSLMLKPIG